MAVIPTSAEFARIMRAVGTVEGGASGGTSLFRGKGIAQTGLTLIQRRAASAPAAAEEISAGEYVGQVYTTTGSNSAAWSFLQLHSIP